MGPQRRLMKGWDAREKTRGRREEESGNGRNG
jgi:hypothetical protein